MKKKINTTEKFRLNPLFFQMSIDIEDDNKENIHCCCLLSNHDRISVFD